MFRNLITMSLVAALSISAVILTGCESDAQLGALIGAGAGAGVGQAIGRNTEGTLIGTALGLAGGYIVGNEIEKKKEKEKQQAEMAQLRAQVNEQMNTVSVPITNSNGSVVEVKLRKQGVGYVGPRGEYYASLPTADQLKPVYGF
jgi:uncharacterized protein YcfJ